MILYLELRDDVIIFCNVHARARNYIEDEVHSKKHSFVIRFWFLHDAIQVCLLSRIGTVVAADLYQIVQNMFVSVQYEPRNLGNAYAVSEPYYGYDSGTLDCRSVSDQLQQ